MPDLTTPTALDERLAGLAHPVRRCILELLGEGERPVAEIARPFGVSRPAVSQHLRVLLHCGLVAEQRRGRERVYRVRPEGLREVDEWLSTYRRFWADHLGRLASHLDAAATAEHSQEARP